MRILLCVLLACTFAGTVSARDAAPLASDPALEKRMVKLAAELRCLVCQNQSLADSNAGLAVDLRNQVRAQMVAGRSDDEIRQWLTERYGDFVLYRPPVNSSTWLLWFGPFALLAVGLACMIVYLRRRRMRTEARQLSVEEHRRAQALLNGNADEAT